MFALRQDAAVCETDYRYLSIPHVVVGAPDPNPLVAGRGVRMMREAGIRVDEDVLKDECIALNKRFMTAHTSGRPWIQAQMG